MPNFHYPKYHHKCIKRIGLHGRHKIQPIHFHIIFIPAILSLPFSSSVKNYRLIRPPCRVSQLPTSEPSDRFFLEIWHEHYTTADHSHLVLFNFLHSAITAQQTQKHKVGVTLNIGLLMKYGIISHKKYVNFYRGV